MKRKEDDETWYVGGWQSENEHTESLLNALYDFRFNTVKSRVEYWAASSSDLHQPVTKFTLNSFKRRLDVTAGIIISTKNICTILESDFAGKVYPIRKYFNVPPLLSPAEHGHIGRLLNTVQIVNPGRWEECFTKWLIGVVVNAMNDTGCQDHTCLALAGDRRGWFKLRWLDNLYPIPLKNYLFTREIDPQSKDILTLIAEYPSINIDDQLRELNRQNGDALKNLITTPAVKYHRPYDTYIEEYPHLASLMVSVNGDGFLIDPASDRHFLPSEVLHTDKPTTESIRMNNVRSEIMCLHRQGVRYWFDDSKIEELHLANAGFEVQTVESKMLIQCLEKPAEEEESSFLMTAAQMLVRLRGTCAIQLSGKRLGEALRKAGFRRVQRRIDEQNYLVCGYRMKPVSASHTNDDYG